MVITKLKKISTLKINGAFIQLSKVKFGTKNTIQSKIDVASSISDLTVGKSFVCVFQSQTEAGVKQIKTSLVQSIQIINDDKYLITTYSGSRYYVLVLARVY